MHDLTNPKLINNPRVLVLIPTLNKLPRRTIETLLNQTLKPVRIIVISGKQLEIEDYSFFPVDLVQIIYDKPNMKISLGERVARALNKALDQVNISDYDFILKADSDIIFPPDFIEMNLFSGYDLMGRGSGMLIKVKPFEKYMRGAFFETVIDDNYLIIVFQSYGLRVLPFKWIHPAIIINEPSYTWRRMFKIGEACFRCGDTPIRFILTTSWSIIRNKSLIHIFQIIGYVHARKKDNKYPIAELWSIYNKDYWSRHSKIFKLIMRLDELFLSRCLLK